MVVSSYTGLDADAAEIPTFMKRQQEADFWGITPKHMYTYAYWADTTVPGFGWRPGVELPLNELAWLIEALTGIMEEEEEPTESYWI